jgi:hypothetical protein
VAKASVYQPLTLHTLPYLPTLPYLTNLPRYLQFLLELSADRPPSSQSRLMAITSDYLDLVVFPIILISWLVTFPSHEKARYC